jgi:hypothetical protein
VADELTERVRVVLEMYAPMGAAHQADALRRAGLLGDELGLRSRIESELLHAEVNGHRLDRDCQGVAPGAHVPAVTIDYVRGAMAAPPAPRDEDRTRRLREAVRRGF